MNMPHHYEIRINGQLSEKWSDWFDRLEVSADTSGQTVLRGCLADQAELIGVLTKIHSLNIVLLSVNRVSP